MAAIIRAAHAFRRHACGAADARHALPSYGGGAARLLQWADQPPDKETAMSAACATCGNVYDKAFQVTMAGETYTFDSFECAISALAPTCAHCRCRIIGHAARRQTAPLPGLRAAARN